MKELLTKKLIIIVSVVTVIVLTAVILAFATGNTSYPSLSDPNGVFYQRLDDQGNVIYTITNQEIYEEIKANDGIQQLIYMTDSILLADYISQVTQEQIDAKLLELTYGTSDPEEIAKIDDTNKSDLETQFLQSMVLGGFQNNEDEYARLMVARELYAMDHAIEIGEVSERDIITEYLDNYFGDISAIKIRFTSAADANFVLQKVNLVSLSGLDLREYNGYVYDSELLVDANENIIEAYIPLDVYYIDSESSDIYDTNDAVVYEFGANDLYYKDGITYTLDASNNLVNSTSSEVVIPASNLFDNLDDAKAYKLDNQEYFTVTRTDPFDMTETIQVLDSTDTVVYTIDSTGHIFDTTLTDVTYTTDLVVNKVYTAIEDVTNVTSNNSTALTEEEILVKYIEMYNYVYGVYRDTLPSNMSAAELATTSNESIHFNYDDTSALDSSVATYMFDTLSIANDERYSLSPESINGYYYLVYKLTETPKEDVMSTIWNYLEPLVVIPTVIGGDIELPTTTYYDGTITWTSGDATVIANDGTVTLPAVDTSVTMTYKITVLGKTYTNTIQVTVLASGETEAVTTPNWTEVPLQTIMNDPSAYSYLYDKLLNDFVYGTNASDNIDGYLQSLRADLNFQIFDHYVGLDYTALDSSFVTNAKGDKAILASFDSTLTSDEPLIITADDYLEFALTKNAALYTLYASQYKELLYSTFYTDIFGTQKDLVKNNAPAMTDIYTSLDNAKSYYTYMVNMYAQYGLSYGYTSFADYAYNQYGTKTELELMQYFVSARLQPYLIDEVLTDVDILTAIQSTVQEYYDNYFSLSVNQLLVYLDFNEDGTPDNFYDYKDELTVDQETTFSELQARLEQAIDEYDGTFSELIDEYNSATREDATWGEFKQNGFFMLTEYLDAVDSNDSSVYHSLTYSGTYGVKDTYVPEFVDALIALYQEYQLPQNYDKTEMYSPTVETEFGLHIILATQGDDFDKPSCAFTEEDSTDPQYTVGSENASKAPSMEQMQLYALYKFYSTAYDLTDDTIEATYGITVPNLPTDVQNALDVYVGDILNGFYVIGTINVAVSDRISNGEFVTNAYTTDNNAVLMDMLTQISDIYFTAVYGDYITE
ncbi:MAG: hypothetical protein JXL85_08495 [Bacilli bacterium]|nr:hypothetical protein [Bacilli bacterium]